MGFRAYKITSNVLASDHAGESQTGFTIHGPDSLETAIWQVFIGTGWDWEDNGLLRAHPRGWAPAPPNIFDTKVFVP